MKETLFVVSGTRADPHEAMARLWQHAMTTGLLPTEWRLGMAAHRRFVGAQDGVPWSLQRREEAWGCEIKTIALGFTIQLLAVGHLPGEDGEFHILEWNGDK